MRRTLLTLALFATPALAQTAWTDCGVEGGSCTLPAQKQMRYGEPFNNRWTAPRTVVGVIPCTNTYWTDPSVSVGKRCQTKDLDAPTGPQPPSGPVWSAGTFTLEWDAPTQNTDGTPIAPPITYRATVDPGARVLEPITSPHVVSGLAAGTYSVTVSAKAGGLYSDESTSVAVTIVAPPPTDPCVTSPLTVSGGSWPTASQPLVSATYADVRGCRVVVDSPPAPPLPTYVVRPNGTSTSRPAYSIVAGARTSTVAGRVAVLAAPLVGTPCDCVAFKSGDYCSVTGQPNVATAAIDVLPASAAVCRSTP